MTRLVNRLSAPWLMVLATLLFACMNVCVKLASQSASTGEVVFFRGGIGALLTGLMAWRAGMSLRTNQPMLHFKRGASGVTALAMSFFALSALPLATAVTLNYMSSVWMAVFLLLNLLWQRTRHKAASTIPLPMLLAVAAGFIGVTLVLRPTFERDLWLPGLVGLCSGMLSAVAYFQVASLGRTGEPEVRVVFYFSLFGAASGLLIGAFEILRRHEPWTQPTMSTLMALMGAGIFATLAQVCLTRAYARGNALAMACLQYLGIVHAFLFGVLLFDDPIHASSLIGMPMIILAGMAATWSQAKFKSKA